MNSDEFAAHSLIFQDENIFCRTRDSSINLLHKQNIFRNTKNYIVSLNNVNKKPMSYFDLESNVKTSSVANNDIPIYVLPSITFEIQNFYSDLGPDKVFYLLKSNSLISLGRRT